MIIPPADFYWFKEQLEESLQLLTREWEHAGSPELADEPTLTELNAATDQLINLLGLIDSEQQPTQESAKKIPDLDTLAIYGLNLIDTYIELLMSLKLEDAVDKWERLAIAFSRWILSRDGYIPPASCLINGLARIANRQSEQAILRELYMIMSEIVDLIDLELFHQGLSEEELDPIRILLFNRAIVATRLISPRLMESAFDSIIEYIPEQAPDFFREGMEQLEIQNYPTEVREVMEAYYQAWPDKRLLH